MNASAMVDNQAKANMYRALSREAYTNFNYAEAIKFTQMANAVEERGDQQAQSLKEQALEALEHILKHSSSQMGAETIRRALSKLSDDL